MEIKTFEDLVCWQKATELRRRLINLIKSLPATEKYELVSQMRRASRSVTHNLAEGFGRFHFQENIQFCRISRGSLYELLDQLIVAKDEEYINEENFKELKVLVLDTVKVLNGYIGYLNRAKTNNQ